MSDARVPIPLTGGLDDSTDPLALRPPFLSTNENTRVNRKGSVSKRPGTGSLLNTVTGNGLVVAGQDRLLTLGAGGGYVVAPDGTLTALSAPSTPPVTVRRFDVAAPQGYVHCVQAKASATHVCVAWSFVGDVTTHPAADVADTLSPTQVEMDFRVAAAILDSDLRVVWGPHLLPEEMKALPRVEPTGDEQFTIFALGTETAASRNILGDGEEPDLYGCTYELGSEPGTAEFLGVVFTTNGAARATLYDTTTTYLEENDVGISLAALNRNNGGNRELRLIGFVNGVVGTPTDFASTVTTDAWSVGIAYDDPSDTVLIYDRGDNEVHTIGTLSGTRVVTAVTLLNMGLGGLPGYDYSPGPAANRPHFYRDEDGDWWLNERPFTLAGSNPATPTFGAAVDERLPIVYEPVVLGDQVVYGAFYGGPEGGQLINRYFQLGATGLDLYAMDSDGRHATVASLGETRLGDPGHTTYEWLNHRRDPGDGTVRHFRGANVRGQVAQLGGYALFPMPLLTSLQNLRGAVEVPTAWVDTHPPVVYEWASPNAHGGAGFYNDEQQVVLVGVAQTTDVHSTSHFGAGRLVAAGGLRVWSGDRALHPVALRRPAVGAFDNLGSEALSRRVDPEAVGVDPGSTTGTGEVKLNGAWYGRVVLVATDANGLQYRSPPSDRIRWWSAGTEDTIPDFCPVAELFPHFGIDEILAAGLNVDVEFYVTNRAENSPAVSAPGDIDESTYALAGRTPLQRDADGFFLIDLMRDYARYETNIAGWGIPSDIPPRRAEGLFTLTGELEPTVPPATQVVARAGQHVFLLPAEAPTEVWFSKPLVAGRAPEFNPLLSFTLPPEAGRAVSLAATYDRVYILTDTGVYELPAVGGPDATGAGSFPALRLTYEGDPCVTHMGTVSTPQGVFYVSRTGPKLIGQDGSPQPLGDRVESLADWTTVRDSVYNEAAGEVVWYTTTGAVVFSTMTGAWSTATLGAQSVDVLDGVLYRINSAGALRGESPTSAADGATYPLATVSTAWIDFGDPLAWKRANEIVILGRIENDPTPALGKLLVEVAYDYDDTVVDSFDFRLEDIPTHADGTFRLEVMPTQGKSDAIKITIRDTTETADQVTANNYLWTIVALEIRAKGKPGLSKLPATAKGG